MGFVANQMVNFMVSQITKNNPKMAPYLNEIQSGADPNAVLSRAIQNGAITRQQFAQAKPMLSRYGKQMGINVSQQDIQSLEQQFNRGPQQPQTKTGFRF